MKLFLRLQRWASPVPDADASFMGKVIVILVMFMGRIGPVTLAVALRRRTGRKDVDIQRPEQRILIG